MNIFITNIMFFLVFWIILAEKTTLESVIIGMGVCVWVYFLNNKYKTATFENFWNFARIKYIIVYLLILIQEVIIANIQVAKVVLSRKMNITPGIIQFRTKLKSELARTILANSITLTPGTVTVLLEGDILTVHCLQKDNMQDILNSKFEKILLKIEE